MPANRFAPAANARRVKEVRAAAMERQHARQPIFVPERILGKINGAQSRSDRKFPAERQGIDGGRSDLVSCVRSS